MAKFKNGSTGREPIGGNSMLQRGRKSRSSRQFLALVGRTTDSQASAPPHDPPAPPDHLVEEPDREIWCTILRENDINPAGRTLLSIALNSLARSRQCAEIIDKAGGPLVIGGNGMPKRHPLAGIEVQNRKLARDIFKLLRIEFRGGELFD
jgi:hypothetical protein